MFIIKNVSKAAPAILELETLFAKAVVATHRDGRQLLLIPNRRGEVKVTKFTDAAKTRTKIVHSQETKSWEFLGISYNAETKELAFERELER